MHRSTSRTTALIAIIALVVALFVPAAPARAAGTSDIPDGFWAEADLTALIDAGIMDGYPDGTFRPNNTISRSEFVTLVNRAAGLDKAAYAGSFHDVKAADWFAGQVGAAVSAGYVKGDDQGNFNPTAAITRNEAAVMIDRALGLDAAGAPNYPDAASIPSWAAPSVAAVSAAGYLKGYPDGTFGGVGNITRAEAGTLIHRAIDQLAARMPRPVTISVIDKDGKAVAAATVQAYLYRQADKLAQGVTGDSGTYSVSLRPAVYDLTATTARAAGHLKYTVTSGVNEAKISVGLGTDTLALSIDGPATADAGKATDFTVRIVNTGAALPENAKVQLLFAKDEGAVAAGDLTVEYLDATDNQYKPLPLSPMGSGLSAEFGPADGFAVPSGYNAATPVRVTVNNAGTYEAYAQVVTVGSEAMWGAPIVHTLVVPGQLALTVSGPSGVTARQPVEYTIHLKNTGAALNQKAGLMLVAYSLGNYAMDGGLNVEYLDSDGQFKYLPLGNDTNTTLVYGVLGPEDGFTIGAGFDTTITIRVTVGIADVVRFAFVVVGVDDNTVYVPGATATIVSK